MKLIDVLVEELPKRGGCPEGANFIAQDEGRATWSFINKPAKDEDDEWMDDSETNHHKLLGHLPKASDYRTAIITREQYEAALAAKNDENDLNECIEQDAVPVWSGEGQPSVGVECEYSWAGEPWASGVIRYISKHTIIIETQADSTGDTECAYHPTDIKLRPLRTEADRRRDEAVKAIMLTGWCQAAAEEIYDLVAAGKVPGMKVED